MSWKMKLAFLIAGKELQAWNSKHNRIVARMATSMAEGRIIKLLKEERWKFPDGSPAGGEVYLPIEQAIALIEGEQK